MKTHSKTDQETDSTKNLIQPEVITTAQVSSLVQPGDELLGNLHTVQH